MISVQNNFNGLDISKINKTTGLTALEERILSIVADWFSEKNKPDNNTIKYLLKLKRRGVLPEKFNIFIQ